MHPTVASTKGLIGENPLSLSDESLLTPALLELGELLLHVWIDVAVAEHRDVGLASRGEIPAVVSFLLRVQELYHIVNDLRDLATQSAKPLAQLSGQAGAAIWRLLSHACELLA